MKVGAFVPTIPAMSSVRRAAASRPRRAALAVACTFAVLVAGGPAVAQDVETDEPEVVTSVTTPDGEPDAAAQSALDATLALAPTDPPPSPDDVFVAPIAAQAERVEAMADMMDATQVSDQANLVVLDLAARAQAAQKAEAKARKVRDRDKKQLALERKRLSDLTVRAYVTGGDADLLVDQAMLEGDTTDPIAGQMIMFEQVVGHQTEVTEQAIKTLAKAQKTLKAAIAAREAADQRSADSSQVAGQLEAARVAAVAAHDEAVAAYDRTILALRTAPRGVAAPLEVPLIGMPRLSAEDLALWFEASPYNSKIATPIADIARWFIEEGRAEGIRGDVAFVQAILETGGFTNSDSVLRHNYSGIGHYDNLKAGWTFPSAQAGVRAQIQLLKSYAMKQPQYANTLVDRRLRGPAGCCVSWGDLTKKWATDPTYGPKVMLLYTSLVDFALARRAAGEGLDVS